MNRILLNFNLIDEKKLMNGGWMDGKLLVNESGIFYETISLLYFVKNFPQRIVPPLSKQVQ